MSHYQGHMADGSGIQKHSAGGLYPYVIFAQQQGPALRWGYIAPDGKSRLVADSYDAAADAALAHKMGAAKAVEPVKTSAIVARDRHDIDALVRLRKALDAGAQTVRIAFLSGAMGAIFTQADLPAVRRKITYSM